MQCMAHQAFKTFQMQVFGSQKVFLPVHKGHWYRHERTLQSIAALKTAQKKGSPKGSTASKKANKQNSPAQQKYAFRTTEGIQVNARSPVLLL